MVLNIIDNSNDFFSPRLYRHLKECSIKFGLTIIEHKIPMQVLPASSVLLVSFTLT